MNGCPTKAQRVLEVIWPPTPPGWLKINMDGASFGGPRLTGCVGVFRICRGFVKSCFAILLSVCFGFKAEIATAVRTIEYAWFFNWRRLWLESDWWLCFVHIPLGSLGHGALFGSGVWVILFRWTSSLFIYNCETNRVTDCLAFRAPKIVALLDGGLLWIFVLLIFLMMFLTGLVLDFVTPRSWRIRRHYCNVYTQVRSTFTYIR